MGGNRLALIPARFSAVGAGVGAFLRMVHVVARTSLERGWVFLYIVEDSEAGTWLPRRVCPVTRVAAHRSRNMFLVSLPDPLVRVLNWSGLAAALAVR